MPVKIANSNSNWIASLTDAGVKGDLTSLTADGTLSSADLVKILQDIATHGAVTASQFKDLQTIAANLNVGVGVSDYLASAFTQLVGGSPANAYWTGGSTTHAALGNLQAGSSAAQLTKLIGKWLQGTDLPDPTVLGSSKIPTYKAFSTPLYGSSGAPVVGDIAQGAVGDCEVCAGLVEMTLNHPDAIKSMIVDNGNGTYGVRFYVGGDETWVTVNNQLAVNSSGALVYNNAYTASNQPIWADLVEKGYAQLSETGLTGHSTTNAFSNINGNGANYVAANLTNSDTLYFSSSDSGWANDKQVFIQAIKSGNDVVLESFGNTKDSAGKQQLVANHAFAVIGYDDATGNFIVRNPWGYENQNQTYNTQFEVSMNDIAAVQGNIVVDNSARTAVRIRTVPQGVSGGSYAGVAEVTAGGSIAVGSLFSAIDTPGAPIVSYTIQVAGLGSLALNGATNLATAAQKAQGVVAVSAGDLAKVSFAGGSAAGASNLLVAAYDGTTWSPTTDVSLKITSKPVAVTPVVDPVVAASGKVGLASLFKVSGSMNTQSGAYQIGVEGGTGTIDLNGAYSWGSGGYVDVSAGDLSKLTLTAPSTSGSVTLDVWAYNGSTWSDEQTVRVLVSRTAAAAIQNYDDGRLSAAAAVADSATNIVANLEGLQTMLSAGVIDAISVTGGAGQTASITAAQLRDDRGALSMLAGQCDLNVGATASTLGPLANLVPTGANNTLQLSGGGSFDLGSVQGFQALALTAGSSYSLKTADATVAAGKVLSVNAAALGAGNTLTFDGSAETNASFAVTGGAGGDSLTGGAGNDVLNGGAGADTMTGGAGDDTYSVDNANDRIVEALHGGNDRVLTSVSYALQAGSEVETLAAADPASTTALTLTGNEFANTITGNAGNDTLDGKGGNDTLYGLGGRDTFVFDTTPNTTTNDVTIKDFVVGDDMIALSHAIFGAVTQGSLASAFTVGSAAQNANQHIIYNPGTGALLYDADGSGSGAAVQFAKLSTGLALSASQFQVTA